MVPQRDRIVDDPQPPRHLLGQRGSVVHLEGQHRREVVHLAPGEVVLRVRRQPGIDHPPDARMVLQEAGHRHGVLLVRLHADRKRGRAPHDEPGVEGRENPAVVDRRFEAQRRDVLPASEHRAAHRVAVPADVLGERVHDVVGAQLEGTGRNGCGEGGIDRHADSGMRRGDLPDGLEVGEPHDGVGGGLQPDQPGFGADGGLHVQRVGGVHERRVDPHAVERVAAQLRHAGVVGVGHDDVVAGAQQREEHAGRGGHTGAEAETGLGAFQRAKLGFELRHGGVRPARVEIARLLVEVVGGEAPRLARDEGGRHDQVGRRGSGGGVRRLAGVDGGGAEAGGGRLQGWVPSWGRRLARADVAERLW